MNNENVDYTQGMKGNIHTEEFIVNDEKPINDDRVTRDYTTKNGIRKIRVNASKPSVHSKQTGRRFSGTPCESLMEYRGELEGIFDNAGIDLGSIQGKRLDFKFDLYDSSRKNEWIKIVDMVIDAFIVKHRVTEKNQYRGGVAMGFEHKSTKATKGKWELENYNKAIQQGRGAVSYRLEIRC